MPVAEHSARPETAVARGADRAGALLRIHAAAHALYIVARVAQVLLQDDRLRYAGYAGAFVIAGTGLLFFDLGRRRLLLPFVLVLYVVMAAVLGLAEDNPRSYWQIDVASFGTLFAVWAGARPGALRAVVRAYGGAIAIAAAIVIPLMFIRLRPAALGERFAGEGFRFLGATTLMPALLLLFYQRHLGRVARYATYAALAGQTLFGLITASRGMVLLPVAALAGYVAFLRGGAASTVRRWVGATILTGAVALLVWSPQDLDAAWQNTLSRMETKGDFWSGRKLEAEFLLEELTPDEMVVGRGLGGALPWIFGKGRDDAPELMNLVHYGHYHLILKGGIILLSLVALLLLVAAAPALRARDVTRRAHGLSVLIFVMANLAHTQFLYGTLLPFIWVVVGDALARPTKPPAAGGEA